MEEESWEGLEVDDSDLRSLLQPCKRLRHDKSNGISAATTSSNPPFTTISASSHISEGGNHNSLLQTESTHPPPQSHRIPGPAAVVQSAMHQRDLDRQFRESSLSQDGNPIPTQDYVRKAVEGYSEFDYDFKSNAWVCALHFIREVSGITTLKSITKCMSRVEKVVAVIKSSKPNGLGGLMVTLKDPTGTITASIHPKVLGEGKFCKNIDVGTVVVLKEVAVFAPSRSAVCLNITVRNLEKVFPEDSDCLPTNAEKCDDTCVDVGEMDEDDAFPCNNTLQCMTQLVVEKESVNFREGTVKGIEEIIKMTTTHVKQSGVANKTTESSPKNHLGESQKTGEVHRPMHASQQEFKETDKVVCKAQPVVSMTQYPEWTDEQLLELFAGDEMDG
ncbi:unnamed protein product [Cuscuta epithymum]|uniref:Homologous recombination OB-fold protein OB-fold domain-containing protein n=2 Tax=Cuscuta epithymum TaxID=186058 RepID=A0AAV0G816_9ASTE|nr:unnamed protein product [Cuscuta epithymum]